ncbi:MAG TPA: FHA domain-containing protein, partial [candidate division Zixibacteria bacterium]|nr:FHA domain-containing protein [candidate division Zixibacteria bacterium]
MYEIWIEESGQEIHRQILSEGSFYLGRSQESDVSIANANLSRQHLQINIANNVVRIMDLGSTNGTQLGSFSLSPHQETIWQSGQIVRIGRLELHMDRLGEPSVSVYEEFSDELVVPDSSNPLKINEVATIICSQAEPSVTTLSQQSI